ncbi:MAG: ABC transporter permease subunit [Gammaproteobacteria bacterium]|nr:ABC transporter permease subunit [Gammaproteobacteria bacterium]
MRRLLNIQPSTAGKLALGALPFVLTLIIYVWVSDARLNVNPNDKLMPALSSFVHAIHTLAFEPSVRTGEYLFWVDTLASLKRLFTGVGIAALAGLILGLVNGAIPMVRANLSPYITVLSLIPPMAILPILFIVFGLDELSKVMLIVIGITPFLIRDLQAKTLELPHEQLIKAQTLGASTWLVVLRVLLPQILPRLIEGMRLSLGAAWLFLIAAEAIAAQDGLGYRIFLVRRYLSMDIILPYVVWITLLAFVTDWVLRKISVRAFPWFHAQSRGT